MSNLQEILNGPPVFAAAGAFPAKERIVIVGCGTAAHKFIGKLHSDPAVAKRVEITVIGVTPDQQMTPKLIPFITGAETETSVVNTFPETNGLATFKKGEVTDVDFGAKKVLYNSPDGPATMGYDTLLLAMGSDTNLTIPGAAEHCYYVKTRDSTAKLISAMKALLASPPPSGPITFVVVGGGITGVEAVAAIALYVRTSGVAKFGAEVCGRVQYVLATAGDHLPTGAPDDAHQIAETGFKDLGIKVYYKTKVAKVHADHLDATGASVPPKLPYSLCVWAVGIKHNSLTTHLRTKLGCQLPGGIPVNQRLQVVGVDSMWAAGDCSTIIPAPLGDHSEALLAKAKETGLDQFWTSFSAALVHHFPQVNPAIRKPPSLSSDVEFLDFVKSLDENYRTPVAKMRTAWVAGVHLGTVFATLPPSERDRAKAFVSEDLHSRLMVPRFREENDELTLASGWTVRPIAVQQDL